MVMDYKTLFEAIVDAVIVINKDGQILDVNRGCLAMFGHSKEDLLGTNVSILMEDEHAHRHNTYITSFMQSRQPKIIGRGREVNAVDASGKVFPARLTVAEAQYAGVPQFVGILQDLSKQYEAEAAANEALLKLQQLDRSLTVAELGSALAHELNQPLTALSLYLKSAQKFLDGTEASDQLSTLFDKASVEGRRAADIIKRIRSMIERREIDTREVQVSALMQDVVRFMRSVIKNPNLEIKLDRIDADPIIDVDPIQASQVLTNLIKNAAEAIESVREDGLVQVSWRMSDDGQSVTLQVEDNGPGFTDDVLSGIFTSFRTTKDGGLGIGLSLSKRLVEQMGGTMSANNSSALGGACVSVIFPVSEAAA